MNTQFTKSYSKNYMILEDFPDYDYTKDFRLNMLSNNSIGGTLDFSYEIVNNKPVFKYDITSKQSFCSLFSTSAITYKPFISVVMSLIDTIGFLEEYLIDINSLIINPEYIFLDPEKYTTYFLVCPAKCEDFYASLSNFFDDILKKINHSDDKLVLLAYRLSALTSKEGFNISMLKNIILSSSNYQPPATPVLDISEYNSRKKATDNFASVHNSSSAHNNSEASDFSFYKLENNFANMTDNNDNISKISSRFIDSIKNSTFIHNKSQKFNDLYTISTSFYTKSIVFGGIFLIIMALGIFCLLLKKLSTEFSLLIIIFDFIFLTICVKYLYELFPSAKIPFIKDNNSLNSQINNTSIELQEKPENNIDINSLIFQNNDSDDSLYKSDNSLNYSLNTKTDEYSEYGNTVILHTRKADTNHRLIYTGTDYVDNVPINSYPFTIGKLKNSANMIINNPLISRIHACIYSEDDKCYIEDMNSANGTYINGKLLKPHEKFPIKEGDQITFAHLVYIFE